MPELRAAAGPRRVSASWASRRAVGVEVDQEVPVKWTNFRAGVCSGRCSGGRSRVRWVSQAGSVVSGWLPSRRWCGEELVGLFRGCGEVAVVGVQVALGGLDRLVAEDALEHVLPANYVAEHLDLG